MNRSPKQINSNPLSLRRSGFTPWELVVVCGLVTVLAAVLLPAVLKAREAARQQTSVDNLRVIGGGMQAHVDTFGFLPGNGSASPGTVPTPDARTLNPNDAEEPYQWGYGDPRRAGRQQPGSWAYAILPFIGYQKDFAERNQAVVVSHYYVPGRRKAVAEVALEESDPIYKGWMCLPDGVNPWGKTDYAANDRIIRGGVGNVMKLNQIADGLSQSILVGEKAMDSRAAGKGGWYWDEPIILGGSGGTGRKGKRLLRDGPILEDAADNWGSPNAAGVAFLFADGSVRTLDYGVSDTVMSALISPFDGKRLPGAWWRADVTSTTHTNATRTE